MPPTRRGSCPYKRASHEYQRVLRPQRIRIWPKFVIEIASGIASATDKGTRPLRVQGLVAKLTPGQVNDKELAHETTHTIIS
jgi:hypothetical protein